MDPGRDVLTRLGKKGFGGLVIPSRESRQGLRGRRTSQGRNRKRKKNKVVLQEFVGIYRRVIYHCEALFKLTRLVLPAAMGSATLRGVRGDQKMPYRSNCQKMAKKPDFWGTPKNGVRRTHRGDQ